jgi:hypothetical protein
MDGCPATLVLSPAFTTLALLMNGENAKDCDSMNRHALAPHPVPRSNEACEGVQPAQTSTERP